MNTTVGINKKIEKWQNKVESNDALIIENNKVIATKSKTAISKTFDAPTYVKPAEVQKSQQDLAEFSVDGKHETRENRAMTNDFFDTTQPILFRWWQQLKTIAAAQEAMIDEQLKYILTISQKPIMPAEPEPGCSQSSLSELAHHSSKLSIAEVDQATILFPTVAAAHFSNEGVNVQQIVDVIEISDESDNDMPLECKSFLHKFTKLIVDQQFYCSSLQQHLYDVHGNARLQ